MVSGLIPSPTKKITFLALFVFQRYERDSSSSLLAELCQWRLSASRRGKINARKYFTGFFTFDEIVTRAINRCQKMKKEKSILIYRSLRIIKDH